MIPSRRLSLAGLILVSTGCLIGCSDRRSNQGSPRPVPQCNVLQLHTIGTSLNSPVFMTAPANDATRLVIVQQGGLIRIFDVVSRSFVTGPFLNNNLPSLRFLCNRFPETCHYPRLGHMQSNRWVMAHGGRRVRTFALHGLGDNRPSSLCKSLFGVPEFD